MADRNLEIAGLIGEQALDQRADGRAKKAPATTSKVRFGARRGFDSDPYAALATKPAPGPKDGKSMAELQEEARRKRAEQRAAERSR